MKIRIFTLLAAIFLLSNISWGQVGEYRVRKTETITKKIEKPKVIRENNPQREGFFVISEIGLIGFDNWGDYYRESYVLNANGIFGYEFNNHFAAGIGIGLNITNYLNLPLYISIRGDITKRPITTNITPYYGVDFGYNIKLTSYHMRYNKGILFSPEIGIRTNKIYIGAEFMITKHHKHDYGYDTDPNLVLSIKLGYKIPLNNIQKFW
jgi:hypothetical protein